MTLGFVKNKIVDCARVKRVLMGLNLSDFESIADLEDHIEIEIVQPIEREAAGDENFKDIYEIIDNVDEFRDTVGGFIHNCYENFEFTQLWSDKEIVE